MPLGDMLTFYLGLAIVFISHISLGRYYLRRLAEGAEERRLARLEKLYGR